MSSEVFIRDEILKIFSGGLTAPPHTPQLKVLAARACTLRLHARSAHIFPTKSEKNFPTGTKKY